MAKEVAKTEEKLPSTEAFSYGEMAGMGFEDTKGSDLSIPFFNVLQSNSPQVEEGGVEGAKPGHIFNTVTGELLEQVNFIPVLKEEAWVEWVPRNKGGGFVAAHQPSSEIVQEIIKKNGGSRIPPKGDDGKRISFKHKGNDVIETYYVYGLTLNDEGTEVLSFGVIPFASTKIKPYRDWLTAMYLVRGKPPLFAHRAKLRTTKQKNESGTYYNFQISPLLNGSWAGSLIDPTKEKSLLTEAMEFMKMVQSGVAKADLSQQSNAATESASSHEDSEQAPF